jgi:Integrase core domain
MPDAMAAQNRRRSSRPATGGRPGDHNGGRPDRAECRFPLVIATPSLRLLRRPVEFTQYTSIEFGERCRKAGVRPSMGSVGDAYDNAMCESFFATLECELLARCRFKTQAEARSAVFTFIEGFYNPRRRHSSIGYLSPINYERWHRAIAVDPDAHQPAAVLAAVKDKPSGRPQDGAVLDRRSTRRPHHRAGRDGRMAPPGVEPKNGLKQEDSLPSHQIV